MKIISWNVNSLNIRKNQVLNYLDHLKNINSPCDFLCLQELKMEDEVIAKSDFIKELKKRDFGFIFNGQKTYNGVGIIYANKYEIVGEIKGNVIFLNLLNVEAPSIFAAS